MNRDITKLLHLGQLLLPPIALCKKKLLNVDTKKSSDSVQQAYSFIVFIATLPIEKIMKSKFNNISCVSSSVADWGGGDSNSIVTSSAAAHRSAHSGFNLLKTSFFLSFFQTVKKSNLMIFLIKNTLYCKRF